MVCTKKLCKLYDSKRADHCGVLTGIPKDCADLFKPKRENMQRIEVKGVSFDMILGEKRVFIKEYDKIKGLNMLGPSFTMILEIPKEDTE